MDFFRSAFTANPPPSVQESLPETKSEPPDHDPSGNSPSRSDASAAGWSFGGLIKTLAASSESVISTYRRDLEEFRTGLQKETAVFRDAIKDLPVSLEAGASAAHDSIESVGRAIDGLGASVWHGTSVIISQGKDALLASDPESDCSDAQNASSSFSNPIRYNRFEAKLAAIQSDLRTFCEDPDDLDDFRRWRLSGQVLEERQPEIEDLIGKNGVLEAAYARLVPATVDHETFWSRYFYRVLKLKQAEEARADLVKRAISGEENEELSWDVEDDECEIQDNVGSGTKNTESDQKESFVDPTPATEKKSSFSELGIRSSDRAAGGVEAESDKTDVKMEGDAEKSEEKMREGREDHEESSKEEEEEEEELGWDEIEEIEVNDEKSMGSGFNSSGIDVRKRLSAVEAEEDLSWDFEEEEDDDEPVKK